MYTVIETPTYLRSIERTWSEDEAAEFVDFIASDPQAGDVIPDTGGLRKVRWAAQGKGRRGGARVIYFVRTVRGEIVLVTAYTKGRIENIPAHLLRKLMEKYDV